MGAINREPEFVVLGQNRKSGASCKFDPMHPPATVTRFLHLWLLLLLVSQARGQDSMFSPPLDVRLVELEVFVTNPGGAVLSDLSASQFDLLVDGKPQSIASFVGPSIPSAETRTDSQPIQADRGAHLVLFFDNNNIESLQRNAILKEIGDYLTDNPTTDLMMMIVSTNATGLEIHQGFTRDQEAIQSALRDVADTLAQDQRVNEYRAIFGEIQRLSNAVQDFSGMGIAPQARNLASRIQVYSDHAREDAMRTAGYLWQLTDSMAGLPGRRVIVYAGGVLTMNPGGTIYSALTEMLGARTGPEAQETGALLPAGISTGDSRNLKILADHVSASGIGFYALIDPGRRGALAGGASMGSMEAAPGSAPAPQDVSSPGVGFRSRGEAQETVEILAAATGGLTRTGSKRVDSAMRTIHDDLDIYYLIAFHPDHELDGELHQITVRVDQKNARVRHRRFYRAMSWDQETANLVRSTLHHGDGLNPLDVRVDQGSMIELEGEAARLPISIQVPLSNLAVVPSGPTHQGQITLFYAAGSNSLGTDPIRKVVLPISIPNEDLLEAIGQSASYRIDVDLPPESDRLIVGVRDDLDDRLSTLRLWLENRDF